MGLAEIVINQLKSAVEKRIETLDVDHDGHPDVPELLQHLDNAAKLLEPIVAKIQPADIQTILQNVNHALGNKLNPLELTAIEKALASIGKGLALFEKICLDLTKTA